MENVNTITTYGLNDEQNSYIKACFPTKEYKLKDLSGHSETDLVALNSTVYVINAQSLSEKARNMLWEYYGELGEAFDETVIWLGKPLPPDELAKVFKCYNSFDEVRDNLKYLLLAAHKRTNRAAEFSRILEKGLKVLSLIRNEPGISAREISVRTDLTIRTVQRYIETLRTAGETIIYDRRTNGYKLEDGKSVLYGDYFNKK